jgi:DNA repair exonuclease SbcCD nuclease subunit
MRVLLFSDHHAHAFKPYSNVLSSGINSRLWDSVQVLNQIAKLVKKHKVDVVLFGGDLFHVRGTLNVQTFNLVFDAIAHMRMYAQVGLLVGNHDQTNRTGDVHSVYSLGSVVRVMDKPTWNAFQVDAVTLQVFSLPYHSDKDVLLQAVEQAVQSHPKGFHPAILLGHFGVTGAKVGGNFVLVDNHNLEVADLRFSEFDQVFLGHYHEPQQLVVNVRYLGATHHHNWGDVGSERGCWLWDTQENQKYSEPTLIPLDAPRFVVVEHGVPVERDDVVNNYVRVQFQGELDIAVRLRAEEDLYGLGARVVEFVDLDPTKATVNVGSFHPGMDINEMISSYAYEYGSEILDTDYLISIGQALMNGDSL